MMNLRKDHAVQSTQRLDTGLAGMSHRTHLGVGAQADRSGREMRVRGGVL